MTCLTEMPVYYVMTAKDLISASRLKQIRNEKFDLLGRANEYLNKAERSGVGAATLKELRIVIIDEYLNDYHKFTI